MSFEAFKMGEYGAYVWSSYGLTLVSLVWIATNARHSREQQLQQAQRRAQAAALDQKMADQNAATEQRA